MMPVSHLIGFKILFAYQIDSAGQRTNKKKGKTPGDGGGGCRENDENAVMAARAEGQMRMLSNGTKRSERDGQQQEGRSRTVVLGCA